MCAVGKGNVEQCYDSFHFGAVGPVSEVDVQLHCTGSAMTRVAPDGLTRIVVGA